MFSVQSKFGWLLVASTTLTIFCFILTAHTFIPHNHAHDSLSTGLLSSVHSGVAERELELSLATAAFFAFVFTHRTTAIKLPLSLKFRAQGPEVLSARALHKAFARGILNPRPY